MQDRNRLTPYAIAGLKRLGMPNTLKKTDEKKIVEATCTYFRISSDEFKRKRRLVKYTYPRQCAVYLMARYTKLTLNKMAELVGGADHSTVIYSRDTITNRLKVNDEDVREDIDAIYSIALGIETVSKNTCSPIHSNYNYEISML